MGYHAEAVAKALAAWIDNIPVLASNRHSFTVLMRAINQYKTSGEGTLDVRESVTRGVLLSVFERHAEADSDRYREYCLLFEMLTDNRWQTMFEKSEDARTFIALVAAYIENDRGATAEHTEIIREKFYQSVASWLQPGSDLEHTSMREIAAALFGEPWCAVVYDSRGAADCLGALIKVTQPEFLPGRLALSAVHQDTPLPDIR